MEFSPSYTYLSILRCKTWCIWPELSRISTNALRMFPADSTQPIYVNIQLMSYELRPRPELEPAQPPETEAGPLLLSSRTKEGYWLGQLLVVEPGVKNKLTPEFKRPYKGEIDIELHIGAQSELSDDELYNIASSISYAIVTYLNLSLGDLLSPVAPIHVREVFKDNSKSIENSRILAMERKQFSQKELGQALKRFVECRWQMSDELRTAVGAASRRYLSAQTETDPIDRYCDLWEVCEFLTFDVQAKGGKVSRIAMALTQHMNDSGLNRRKARVEKNLKIRALYQTRNNIVHNAVDNPEELRRQTDLLSQIALELIRFRLDLPYLKDSAIEQYF